MNNRSGLHATATAGGGNLKIGTDDDGIYGGAHDDIGPLDRLSLTLDVDLESAYALAAEIVDAANAQREMKIASIREDFEKWGVKEPRTLQEIEDTIARLPGPFVMAKARKLTDEEKAARAKGDAHG